MTDYRFFLSYSRRDAKDAGQSENAWFIQFRNDLIREVARESKLPASYPDDEVGFYDRQGIGLGDPWRADLLNGLQESRVLVCLYSQNYFVSEYCGKEFQVFLRRQEENPTAPRVIIPVLWEAPTKLPAPLPSCLAEIQFTHASLGADYADKGLLYLLKMKEEIEYQRFLQAIAEKIAQAGQAQIPPAKNISPLEKVASAFHQVTAPSTSAASPAIWGVKAAWMVYVAGSDTDYVKVRTNRAAYGSAGYEWQPYHPTANQIVGAIAASVVANKGLFPDLLQLTDELTSRLEEAEDNNTMVLILVDPWTTRVATFRQVFKNIDRMRFSNCGIIIPWNADDPEFEEPGPDDTTTKAAALEQDLKNVLSHIWDAKDVVFIKQVPSEEALRIALTNAIEEIRKRISDRGRLKRGAPGDDDIPSLPPGAVNRRVTGAQSGGTDGV